MAGRHARGSRTTGTAFLLGALIAAACTAAPAPARPPTPEPVATGTIEDLRRAFARWRQLPVSVTYRTERQRPGLPRSAHQCLRGFVDEREDIPVALKLCDPSGVVRLTMATPSRWRIDVVEGGTITRAIVAGRRALVCIEGDMCHRRTVRNVVRSFPFHELLAPIDRTLAEIGIGRSGPVTIDRRSVGETVADCYEIVSTTSSARWCFGDDGVLRSLQIRVHGKGPTVAEAARVPGTLPG